MAEFDPWAFCYDVLHPGLPGEAEFYVTTAVERGADTLELGCGTGRIAIAMAMSGVRVAGLDLSGEMLAVCAEKLAAVGPVSGSLDLVLGDMRRFRLGRRFPLIVMPYRTLMHCLTPGEIRDCLRCAREHLEPGGEFILNVWAARPSALSRYGTTPGAFVLEGKHPLPERQRLEHWIQVWRDGGKRLLHERHRVIEKGPRCGIRHEAEMTLSRRWITHAEMNRLAKEAGFKVNAVLGDFYGAPYQRQSDEMIWRLRA
ncbi:MAG: class I SAM-dependent methyltransferase [Candidatus Hydrogenedens sp.]|nr:class I SAM-dependent methyltransferase [Candidatus Hydrogenedentota bacterium]NLF56396.1 class I SAM-dependent methyltransferase [Candidatus Hydrogenedens sp.]